MAGALEKRLMPIKLQPTIDFRVQSKAHRYKQHGLALFYT
jgi:hypothetical protein